MAKKKAAERCSIRPWLSARPDCKERRFLQIGDSLLFSDSFKSLSAGAQMLFFCMAMESGGQRSLVFPLSAAKKYGIAQRSFRRYLEELEAAGFIEKVSLANLRKPNEYTFSLSWKVARPP